MRAASPEPVRRRRRLIHAAAGGHLVLELLDAIVEGVGVVEEIVKLLLEREDRRRDVGLAVDEVGEAIAARVGHRRSGHTWADYPRCDKEGRRRRRYGRHTDRARTTRGRGEDTYALNRRGVGVRRCEASTPASGRTRQRRATGAAARASRLGGNDATRNHRTAPPAAATTTHYDTYTNTRESVDSDTG